MNRRRITFCLFALTFFGTLALANDFVRGSGTVTDRATGLTWQQSVGWEKRTWEEAAGSCAELRLGGHADWRLPTLEELKGLVRQGGKTPTIDTDFFPDTPPWNYWSATADEKFRNSAWSVGFAAGIVGLDDKAKGYLVRCVRREK